MGLYQKMQPLLIYWFMIAYLCCRFHTLSEMGCNQFQVFYFSRPVAVDVFEAKFVLAKQMAPKAERAH